VPRPARSTCKAERGPRICGQAERNDAEPMARETARARSSGHLCGTGAQHRLRNVPGADALRETTVHF
jgi:hypothetical protein